MNHRSGPSKRYQDLGLNDQLPRTNIGLQLSQLTRSEADRVELRAQRIYLGLPPLVPWRGADERTRNVFRRRALNLMLFDGSLRHDARPGAEDYGYTELQELDREVAAVVRGELRAGELWRAESDEGSADRGY